MDYEALAELLFPHITKEISDYEERYPKREKKDGAMVTRFAPSPTGFVHMGSMYAAFLSYQLAHQTDGVFFVRIEDTDQKREVENGIAGILNDLETFSLEPDESPRKGGDYGPYIQSERKEIYQTFVKHLVKEGKAYPCFCTEETLAEMRKGQELSKEALGYYGAYAFCRHLSFDEIKEKIEQHDPYVIRFRSAGDALKRIECPDLVKGKVSFPENQLDIVLLKQDGLPTYHLAHIVDDHLMRTTHVVRGDEWLSSLPLHLQLFSAFRFTPPKYAHIAPLTKKDGTTVRKLSKRYDPECSMSYYFERGIPIEAVKIYLMTIANSNFEEWYLQNRDADPFQFTLDFKKMATGGSLFDLDKLLNISKTYLSRLKASDLYERSLGFFQEHDPSFAKLLEEDKDYSIAVFNIEREIKRPRKDIAAYQDIKSEFSYFYDPLFLEGNPYQDLEKTYDTSLFEEYLEEYNVTAAEEEWMNHLREFLDQRGYAPSKKLYEDTPEKYQGLLKDACEAFRAIVTGRMESPNLYYIFKLLGVGRMRKRITFYKQKTTV